MTTHSANVRDLIGKVQSPGTASDMLRILRELMPVGPADASMRSLRKQTTLLRARLNDVSEAERIGTRHPAELQSEVELLVRLSKELAGEILEKMEAKRLPAIGHAMSLLINSRERMSPGAKLGQLFLSYRRSDSAPITGVLRERLAGRFGQAAIFLDIDSIPLGVNFRAHIVSALAQAKACLAVIGPTWLAAAHSDGRRRLDDIDDPIRVELETALRIDRRVIPILTDNATMPKRDDLPEGLRALSSQNGFPLRPGVDFNVDMTRLLDLLDQQLF